MTSTVYPAAFTILLAAVGVFVVFLVVVIGLTLARSARAAVPAPSVAPAPARDVTSGAGFFTAANVWFAVGVTLLIGGWDAGGDTNYSLFGYGRIEEAVYWVATAVVFVAAGYSLRHWLRAAGDATAPDEGRPPAPYFAFAQVWFVVGLLLLLGMQHRSESTYRLFGAGRVAKPVYWGVLAGVVGAGGFSLLRWRRTAAPGGRTAGQDLARVGLAGWVLLGMVGGWAFVSDRPAGHEDVLFLGGPAVLVFMVVALNLARFAFGLPVRNRTNRPRSLRAAAPLAGLVMLVTSGVGLAVVTAAGARYGTAGSWAVWFACLIGVGLLGAVVLLVGLAARPRPARAVSRPPPAAVPTSAASVVHQVFAGCVLVALVPLGLIALGLGLPAWQRAAALGRVGPPEYAGLGLAAALFVALVAWLVRVFRGPRPPAAAPEPAAPPAAAPPPPARECPACRQPVPAGAPQGLCPRCLLKGAMPSAGHPSPTLAFVEAFVAPPVEDVARLLPHLDVTELIGQGGMGAVYLARQTALDRPVALKLIRPRDNDPAFAERFAREARALAKLAHPGVVAVHESGTAGGLPYLVMEYVDGVTLRDAMREKKLEPGAALAVVRQLCDALEYAHAQGVVHRDVKPENVLLTRDGRVKIADFGLAKVADPAAVSLTGTRQAMGTPHYMAPEQWERPAAVDHRADIYALGVVLYELLTGELPLGRFDPPSQKVQVDVRLDEVVLRALAKEPDRRYQRAGHVRTDLDHIDAAPGR